MEEKNREKHETHEPFREAVKPDEKALTTTEAMLDILSATPLNVACDLGYSPDLIRLIIKKGADVNGLNEEQKTPLHVACRNGGFNITRALLKAGADANARDKDDQTPLRDVCGQGHSGIARLLLAAGADINATDSNGWAPLYVACFHGHTDTVYLLLNSGADANARDKWGGTPLDSALKLKADDPHREEIIDLFREYAPESTLQTVLGLPPEDPMREKTLDWYREHHPDLVMTAWCTMEVRL